jgi:PilZ domain
MKAMTISPRIYLPKKKPLVDERRGRDRKDFSYYMQLFNHDTQELVGHLTDISSEGFKLDSLNPIPLNKDFRFRMDLTSEVATKPYMVFVARSKWCKVDPLDPFCYNVGFQLINISPSENKTFNRMIEKYGRKHEERSFDLRRSNLW